MTKKYHLYPGHLAAAQEETLISTLLGSCVAVALYDDKNQVGGLNHYLLPRAEEVGSSPCARYGDYAIKGLIDLLLDLGANRKNLKAKLYGGANLIAVSDLNEAVGKKNIDYAEQTLKSLGIPVVEKNVGGESARIISFNTKTAAVVCKHAPAANKIEIKKVS